jgi:hypothetical protein
MDRTIYEVTPLGAEWVLQRQGSKARRVFSTRDEAIESGREACKANRPSKLRIRKSDDAVERD